MCNNISGSLPKRARCIAHRGGAGHGPENTRAALHTAIALGVDGIEIDVQLCEQTLIVMHDLDLQRTTNGSGCVRDCSLAYLRTLDAGHGEQIPTLSEVLELLPAGIGINIELKGADTAEPVAQLLKAMAVSQRSHVQISSFDWPQLERMRLCAPELDLAPLTKNDYASAREFAETIQATCVNVSHKEITAQHLEEAHHRGRHIHVYTPNSHAALRRALNMGADAIITDYPARLQKLLG